MGALLRDLRYGARLLARAPLFTLAAAVTIVAGIGATTSILSVIHALVLRPLQVPEPERLVALTEVQQGPAGRNLEQSFTPARYREYEAGAGGAFTGLAAHHYTEASFRALDGSRPLLTVVGSENYFEVLALRPTVGRLFDLEDRLGSSPPVVVLSHRLWQREFGEDTSVLGRSVTLDGRPYTVVGVGPAGFGGVYGGVAADLFVPLSAYLREHAAAEDRREVWAEQLWLSLFGRIADGATVEWAEGRMTSAVAGLEGMASYGEGGRPVEAVHLTPLRPLPEWMRGATLGFTGMILLTAVLVLLVGASNVAGLLLARSLARRREIAIRLSLCARRGTIVRQLLTESLLLFAVGGTLGILLAIQATSTMARVLPTVVPGVPLELELDPDPVVLLAATLLMLGTGLVFGAAPALQATRPDLLPGLKDTTRPGPVGSGSRLRGGLVVLQLASSLVLLFGAGLFLRAIQRSAAIEPGFDVERLVVASVNLARHGYDETRGRAFYSEVVQRLEARPEVARASLAQFPHLSGNLTTAPVALAGTGTEPVQTSFGLVGTGWFETVGTEILHGRPLSEADAEGGVVVVNRTLAERYGPAEAVVGRMVMVDDVPHRVIGVARDARYQDLHAPTPPHLYLHVGSRYAAAMTLHVRAVGSPASLLPVVHEVVRAMDPELSLRQPGVFADRLSLLLFPQRLAGALVGLFGLVGLGLAATGIFGVLAFHVEQQRPEIAVRIALGGRAGDVVWMVMKRAAVLVAVGTAAGAVASWMLAPLVEGMVFGVEALDVVPMLGAPLVLVLVALLASWIPARRAVRVDPMGLLRTE